MKSKILFILHIPPPVHGAAMVGQYIRESAIINNTFECRYINLGLSRSVDKIGRNGLAKWFRYFKLLFKTLTFLISFKPSLVYLTLTSKGSGFYKDAIVALLVKGLGNKVVYHFHNKGVSEHQENTFDNWMYKKVFKNTEVILLSKRLYSDIQKYIPKNRVHFCPNGIPDKTSHNLISVLKEKKIQVNILFLSNLMKSKGVYVLLESCAILFKKQIAFHSVFVGGIGDVSHKQFDDKVRELKLEDNVSYLGKKYGKEKNLEFEKADIFAFPTYYDYETFGLVNLEAMQHSLPVISTFEGGITDVVEDGVTGFLVPQRDIHSLAEKLEILINNNHLRTKMGIAGRKKYEEEFTLKAFETKFVFILKELV